jgi:peptidoglycan hydrolase-like protein with peptidoglycan-binding domain
MRSLPLVVALLLALPAADALAHKRHHPRAIRPPSSLAPLRVRKARRAHVALVRDEVRLSPALLRQLQAHLVGGGYTNAAPDGKLTPRTRRAIAAFQREYHLAPTGALTLATADALLGREQITAFIVR